MPCITFGIEWDNEKLIDVISRGGKKSKLAPNMRLQESELAREMGIPFDRHWYGIAVTTREYMIASKLASNYISNLSHKDAVKEAKSESRKK